MKKSLLLAAVAALGLAGAAQAAQVVFTTSNAVNSAGTLSTTPSANPSITVSSGDTVTLYVAAKRTSSVSSAFVNSLGLNIRADAAGLSASSFSVNNPTGQIGTDPDSGDPIMGSRWNGTSNGSLNTGGLLVSNSTAVAVGSSTSGFFQPITGVFKLDGTLTMAAQNLGSTPITVHLFFQTGPGKISEINDNSSTTSLFGFGDAAVSNAVAGSESSIADATITILPVPEPASIGLLGLGAMGLVARRRRA